MPDLLATVHHDDTTASSSAERLRSIAPSSSQIDVHDIPIAYIPIGTPRVRPPTIEQPPPRRSSGHRPRPPKYLFRNSTFPTRNTTAANLWNPVNSSARVCTTSKKKRSPLSRSPKYRSEFQETYFSPKDPYLRLQGPKTTPGSRPLISGSSSLHVERSIPSSSHPSSRHSPTRAVDAPPLTSPEEPAIPSIPSTPTAPPPPKPKGKVKPRSIPCCLMEGPKPSLDPSFTSQNPSDLERGTHSRNLRPQASHPSLRTARTATTTASYPSAHVNIDSSQNTAGTIPWSPSHPCYPHPNPHVPLSSPLHVSTRIIRIPRSWLLAGDLAPTFSNIYPEILAPWISELDFRSLVEKINEIAIEVFNPLNRRNWVDGVLGVLSGWVWEDLGETEVKKGTRRMEAVIEEWNRSMARNADRNGGGGGGGGEETEVKAIPLRRTGYMSLDIQIPDPKIRFVGDDAEAEAEGERDVDAEVDGDGDGHGDGAIREDAQSEEAPRTRTNTNDTAPFAGTAATGARAGTGLDVSGSGPGYLLASNKMDFATTATAAG
ncbi:hypothetical protein MMC09_006076 [Bachmanniomyces sp. S44760]|nr:hypothetical protein [Bachmanniomyces sp. S44760]